MGYAILDTTGFLFTDTSLRVALLKADFGDGFGAGALIGSPNGTRTWAIQIAALPDSLEYARPVQGDTRANYLWEFFLASKIAGNAPFWLQDLKDGKFYLAEFVEDELSYSVLCAELYSTGLQLRQRRVPGMAPPPEQTGLIYREPFASIDAWTNEGSWAIDSTVPTLLAHATSDPSVSFSGVPDSFDAMGVREGGILVEGDTWFMWYDSGNGKPGTEGYVWRQFLATSTDRGATWLHEGQLPIGFNKTSNPADGVWPSRACGWIEKRATTYYLHSIYATALDAGNEIPAGDYFTDVWSGPSPRGPWTWIRQDLTVGAAGSFDEGYCYGTSVVFNAGTYYLFYGGLNAARTQTNVGLASGPTPAGPWTKIAPVTGLFSAAIKGEPENMKVFWHAQLNRWVMIVNQMNAGLSITINNSIFLSPSLTDWSTAQRFDIQHNFPIDCVPAFNAIGMATPIAGADALPLFESDGALAITFDGDTSDAGASSHHGRHEKYTTLEPVLSAIKYTALDTTQRLLSRAVPHGDFVAEFECDAQDFGAGAAISFDFRLDAALGQTGLRLLVRFDNNGDRRLLLQQRTAGVWATITTGTGQIYAATNAPYVYMNRVRVVAVGNSVKAYLGGELQIDATVTATSGNEIAFMGYNVLAHVRMLKMYKGDSITVSDVGPGETVLLRGAVGSPVKSAIADEPIVKISHLSYPLRSIEVGGQVLSARVPVNWALAANGATISATSQYDAAHAATYCNNGARVGQNSNTEYWNSASDTDARTLEVDFAVTHEIELINVFTCQTDPTHWVEPTLALTFTQYGATAYVLEYWTGSAWATWPGGNVAGNANVWRQFSGPVVTTSKIRVRVTASSDNFARLAEVEAWSAGGIWGGAVFDAGQVGQVRDRLARRIAL
jgi:hypothetical protein